MEAALPLDATPSISPKSAAAACGAITKHPITTGQNASDPNFIKPIL